MWSSEPFNAPSTVAVGPYVGPGDIVANALSWWGLRGYTTAYATPGTNPAMDVTKASDGSVDTTINILADGSLDVATISGLGYAVKVKKLYDQTGGGRHMTQATLSKMPTLTLSGLGSLPIMTGTSAASSNLALPAYPSTSNPFTFSLVAKNTSSATGSCAVNTSGLLFGCPLSADKFRLFDTNGATALFEATALDNVWHAVQGIDAGTTVNGSNVYVDGVSTPGTLLAISIVDVQLFGEDSLGHFDGSICEFGIWPSALTVTGGGQASLINANQHSYWGF